MCEKVWKCYACNIWFTDKREASWHEDYGISHEVQEIDISGKVKHVTPREVR